MIGSWAGELGQTQFLPTHYFNYAVDYDGDGHRNLLRSPADVIGSTANYIATGLKWRRGEPWLQEVRAPQNLAMGPGRPDHPASALEMGAMGRHLSGRPRAAERQSAGVAAAADGAHGTGIPRLSEFRGLYRVEQLADLFHHRGLSRHPHRRCAPMRQPQAPVAQLSFNELREMQQLLVRAGFNVGKVDGIMGQQSRTAVKAMQIKYGLPADSWPTAELLARLRGVPAPGRHSGAGAKRAPRHSGRRQVRAKRGPMAANPESRCERHGAKHVWIPGSRARRGAPRNDGG